MDIQIYSIPGCTYCNKLRRLLERDNLPYIQTTVSDKSEFKEQHVNCTGFPWVYIDGEEIGGLMETAKFLVEKGLVKKRE